MADIQLKVTPGELRNKAGDISRQTASAERNWNSLCDTVKASRSYWEGEAGDCGRRLLDDVMDDVQAVFRRLKEHPSDLLEMAGVYTDTEAKASEMANDLPDDVIQ